MVFFPLGLPIEPTPKPVKKPEKGGKSFFSGTPVVVGV